MKILNKYLFITVILISVCSCSTITLGSKIPDNIIKDYETGTYTLLNSSTILPLYKCSKYISVGGRNGVVEFVKDETPNKIINEIKIGDEITRASKFFKKIMVEMGVGYYIPLEDNNFAFIGDINTEESNFKVLFFFKKNLDYKSVFFMEYEAYKEWLDKIEFVE